MLDTILFDMGGTLEDIWYNDDTQKFIIDELLRLLAEADIPVECDKAEFWDKLSHGVKSYKQWSQMLMLEKKPEEIWPDYYLKEFAFPRDKVAKISETLAQAWEVGFYHRELRPNVKETLEALAQRGYKLGIISNTASLYSVFNVLEDYGIRQFFKDVTLSSITGYRKPHPAIFEISTRQMRVPPENCIYVGDTISRDIEGAKSAGFAKAVQITSFMTDVNDTDPDEYAYKPDYVINNDISDLLTYLDS